MEQRIFTIDSEVVYRGSNANGDGRIYPDAAEVRAAVIEESGKVFFEVYETTGWNGYETCPDEWIAAFKTEHDAIEYVKIHYETWSDVQKVLRAAVNMLNKSDGSFAQLKAAVDWRDRQ